MKESLEKSELTPCYKCKYYFGEFSINCVVHPYGKETEFCGDWQEDNNLQQKRTRSTYDSVSQLMTRVIGFLIKLYICCIVVNVIVAAATALKLDIFNFSLGIKTNMLHIFAGYVVTRFQSLMALEVYSLDNMIMPLLSLAVLIGYNFPIFNRLFVKQNEFRGMYFTLICAVLIKSSFFICIFNLGAENSFMKLVNTLVALSLVSSIGLAMRMDR